MSKADQMSEMEMKLLLFIESRGNNISSKTQWAKNALGQGTSSRTSEAMSNLKDERFIEINKNGSIKPTTKEMVRDELSGYEIGDDAVERTYQRLLAEIRDKTEEGETE